MTTILFVGDIVGRPGRRAVLELLPGLKKELEPDLVIANGENLTSGKGFNAETITKMRGAGVDFFTTGNHVYANKDALSLLSDPSVPVIRPANFAGKAPGRGYQIVEAMGKRVLIANIISPHATRAVTNSPFEVMDTILTKTAGQYDIAIVDFHAEFTSDKAVFAWYVDGRVDAVIGTHTHIPTADAHILPKGTAFITDVGMCGGKWSSLGIDIEPLIRQATTQLPEKHTISGGPAVFAAVKIIINGKERQIEQIQDEVGE